MNEIGIVIGVANGIVLSLISACIMYNKGLKEKWNVFTGDEKRKVFIGLSVLVSLVLSALSCYGVISNVPCVSNLDAVVNLIVAIITGSTINQGLYALMPTE